MQIAQKVWKKKGGSETDLTKKVGASGRKPVGRGQHCRLFAGPDSWEGWPSEFQWKRLYCYRVGSGMSGPWATDWADYEISFDFRASSGAEFIRCCRFGEFLNILNISEFWWDRKKEPDEEHRGGAQRLCESGRIGAFRLSSLDSGAFGAFFGDSTATE